jgi:hypothetical protein
MKIKTPKGWRKGQTIANFLIWLGENEVMIDIFYMEDSQLDKLYAKFLKENSPKKLNARPSKRR